MIVDTTSGPVRGKERKGVGTWRGIPYARAPRFRPPVPFDRGTEPRDALAFGPFSMQVRDPRSAMMSGVTDKTEMSEDCLVLNVYAPLTPPAPCPVVVWIHGGAFIMGAGSQPLYDGTSFAANHGLVVVTINYRLGISGLLYLGDLLGPEFEQGNACLLDQVAALAWVRDNIAAFGGDPTNVTVMGESAGSVSVGHLLAMPAARGLFHRAILQSGAINLIPRTRAEATAFATDLASHLGVTPRALLDIDAARLVAAQQHISDTRGLGAFSPFVDGTTIPRPPLELVDAGSAAGIPTLVGFNRDEWRLFDTFLGAGITMLLVAQVRKYLPALDTFHAHYVAARTDHDAHRAWVDLVGDLVFRIPAVHFAEAQLRHADVWMYRFDFASPMVGAAHGLELPFVWNTLDGPFAQALFAGDLASARPLADTMHAIWARFIRDGKLAWPTYDTTRRATMLFDRESRVADDPGADTRALWPR
jgi:para-nitrobenzyl esterase